MPLPDARRASLLRGVAAGLLAASAATATQANDVMFVTEAQARAVRLLQGGLYGRTDSEVTRRIRRGELQRTGRTACAPVTRPVWTFHVVVPASQNRATGQRIGGVLVLDAKSGKLLCTTLPMRG